MSLSVSAIIPCYNQSRWVREAVDSALLQDYPNLQVVAVDDGSTDDTWDVLQSYGSRITAVRQRNQGLSAARNTAIRHATGEWFALLDSDDRWLPGKISKQMKAVRQSSHAGGVGLVFSGCRIFSDSEPSQEHVPKQSWTLAELAARNPVQCPTAMFSRAAMMKVGMFDESLRSCEDWDLWLRIAAAGFEAIAVPEVLAEYRRYAGSMSTHAKRMYENGCRVLRKNRAAMDAAGMTAGDWKAAWGEIHAAYSARLFEQACGLSMQGRRLSAAFLRAKAVAYSPGKVSRVRSRIARVAGRETRGRALEMNHGM